MAETKTTGLSASLEDYLEAIWNLSADEGHAHCTDIAERLNVAKPSVTGALRTLKKKGLANYEPYGSVTLTPAGREAAKIIARKHSIIESFFVDVLGVDAEAAQEAACKAEHALGAEIISRLLNFSEFVSRQNKKGEDMIRRFEKFCNSARNNKRLKEYERS
jgi:DtxR family Mn-dependent transcriptional regulator